MKDKLQKIIKCLNEIRESRSKISESDLEEIRIYVKSNNFLSTNEDDSLSVRGFLNDELDNSVISEVIENAQSILDNYNDHMDES